MADLLRRTNSISSLSLPLAASCLTASATRANSQKRTRPKRSSRCLQLSTTSTATRSCIEVRAFAKARGRFSKPADTILDLKPENLLYVTKDPASDLVLADFGIAKTLDSKEETLQTMAGSFGYAAPEVMNREGHGKPVDMWSMGVITYTLLCGYSPFRSENLADLLEECTQGSVVFHERYWKDVSEDAKDFIRCLIVANPEDRATSQVFLSPTLGLHTSFILHLLISLPVFAFFQEALRHIWLSGQNATEHDLLPELRRAKEARAKLRKAILAIQLQKRIARLRHEAGDDSDDDDNDLQDAAQNVDSSGIAKALSGVSVSSGGSSSSGGGGGGDSKKPSLRDTVKSGAVFREVVLAKVREEKAKKEAALQTDEDLVQEARRRSFNTQSS